MQDLLILPLDHEWEDLSSSHCNFGAASQRSTHLPFSDGCSSILLHREKLPSLVPSRVSHKEASEAQLSICFGLAFGQHSCGMRSKRMP